MTVRQSNVEGNVKIKQDNNTVVAYLSRSTAKGFESVPNVTSDNKLNQWVNISDPEDGVVAYSTQINSSSYTLADWKQNKLAMGFDEFKDDVQETMAKVLQLLYYVEIGKEWYFPLDPLNIIIDKDEQTCKAFYREPYKLKKVDDEWMNNVRKLIMYIAVPEVDNSTSDFSISDPDSFYNNYLYSESDESEDLIKLIRSYGSDNMNALSSMVFDTIFGDDNGNGDPESVRDMLEKLNAGEYISEADEDNSYADDRRVPVNNQKSKLQFDESNRGKKNSNNQKPVKKSSGKGLVFFIIVLLIAAAGGGYFYFQNKNDASQNANQQSSASQKDKSPKSDTNFYNGLIAESSLDHQKAAKDFDKFFNDGGSKDNLSSDETGAVFAAYLNSNNYNKILTNIGSDKTASALVKYLMTKNDTDSIKKLNDSSYSIVKFAKADIDNDYQKMISASDGLDLSDNKQYQDDLCKAYAETGQLTEGKEWAESQNNSTELINAIKAHAYSIPNANKDDVNKKLGV